MVIKIFSCLSGDKAFTLIEVIVSLLLVSIMAAIAGFGFVKISQGYIFTKQNSETVQKAQIAMTRIVKELGAATNINFTTTAPSVNYTRPESASSTTPVTNNIMLSGSTVKIGLPGSETILIDGVTAFTLTYVYAVGSTTTAVANIRRIDVTLRVNDANNKPLEFNNSVWINESY